MLYTKLKHLESEIKELEKLGVVDTSWRRNIRIVEEYTRLREQGVCVYCCYTFIAKDEGISESSVKKIINRLMT